jgi:ATP-binding cassette subfamily B protein
MLVMMGQRAKASAERIFEVSTRTAEITERPGAFDLTDVKGTLDFNHVRFEYANGAEMVLTDFDAHIQAGRDRRHRRSDRLG